MRYVFVGSGRMGGALIHGLIRSGHSCSEIFAADSSSSARAALTEILPKERILEDADEALGRKWDVAVLAVKPQQLPGLIEVCRGRFAIRPKNLIISVAAGITINGLKKLLGFDAHIVRAMPNTPALVGKGATAISTAAPGGRAELRVASDLFGTVGTCHEIDEKHFDAVTALSGSGPAYFQRMMEAMAKWGAAQGIAPELAAVLAWRTASGAAAILEGTEPLTSESFVRQIAAVASPGGTTEAALRKMETKKFDAMMDDILDAARDRSKELSENL